MTCVKWIGFLCIVLGSSGIGISGTRDYNRRIETLTQIKQMMHYIQDMVRQEHLPLSEAIGRSALRMEGIYGDFLSDVASQMELFCGEDIALIWHKQAEKLKKLLGKQYYAEFEHCMDQTGFATATAQADAIRQYERHLTEKIQELNAQREEKCRLYQSLGVIGGIFICVLLL